MKTLTKQEYEALPIEKRRYWKAHIDRYYPVTDGNIIARMAPILVYTPIQINLEDAEGIIEELRCGRTAKWFDSNYASGWYDALTEALNKLKGV